MQLRDVDTSAELIAAMPAAMVENLEAAARLFAARPRQDDFTVRSIEACISIADYLRRYKRFNSDKQAEYAGKLIAWAKPRVQVAPSSTFGRTPTIRLPKLHLVMQRLGDLHLGALKISRKNQSTLCWLLWNGALVGKIDEENVAQIFPKKVVEAGTSAAEVERVLVEIEKDPFEAAKQYGRDSGRCAACGRDLTDPESIANGIGPICASKFA
jgi:hypothetical protein